MARHSKAKCQPLFAHTRLFSENPLLDDPNIPLSYYVLASPAESDILRLLGLKTLESYGRQ